MKLFKQFVEWCQVGKATKDHEARAWKQRRWLIWEVLAKPFHDLFGAEIHAELESILVDRTTVQQVSDLFGDLERKLDDYATDDLRAMRCKHARTVLDLARGYLAAVK